MDGADEGEKAERRTPPQITSEFAQWFAQELDAEARRLLAEPAKDLDGLMLKARCGWTVQRSLKFSSGMWAAAEKDRSTCERARQDIRAMDDWGRWGLKATALPLNWTGWSGSPARPSPEDVPPSTGRARSKGGKGARAEPAQATRVSPADPAASHRSGPPHEPAAAGAERPPAPGQAEEANRLVEALSRLGGSDLDFPDFDDPEDDLDDDLEDESLASAPADLRAALAALAGGRPEAAPGLKAYESALAAMRAVKGVADSPREPDTS